jgi:hypothetical protein
MLIRNLLIALVATPTSGSVLRSTAPSEDAVANTGDVGCVDGLVFNNTLDITRNPPGPHCVKGKRIVGTEHLPPVFVPVKKTMSSQVITLMDTMVSELESELKEATANRVIQLSSYQNEGKDQNAVVGIKTSDLSTTSQCTAAVTELIGANARNTAEEQRKIVSDAQFSKWNDQSVNVQNHAAPYRKAFDKAHLDFEKRYNHLNSVRKLIHNMTATVNKFYVEQHMQQTEEPSASAEKAAQVGSLLELAQASASNNKKSLTKQPRFQEMLQTIQNMMAADPMDDDVRPASLDYGLDNATSGVRTPIVNEEHVKATEAALKDITQHDPQHVKARGHLVKVGSDVGGYVYLVLTRITNTVADELSALKSSFQLQTATRKSVIAQADRNVDKLKLLVADGHDTNKAANKRIEELKKELTNLNIKADRCKRDINDATVSLEGSKHLATNLHLTLEELTSQLDRQITDIKHELKLANWARKLMLEKLHNLKNRVVARKARAAKTAVADAPAEDTAEVVMDEKACLEGGPQDWCKSMKRMFHCGVTQASCDAYLAADPVPDIPWPGHDLDQAANEKR